MISVELNKTITTALLTTKNKLFIIYFKIFCCDSKEKNYFRKILKIAFFF